MYNDQSDPTFTNCVLTYNVSNNGAGIYNSGNCYLTLSDCTLSYNLAFQYGGGMYSSNAGVVVVDSVVCSNLPEQLYGAYTDNGGNTIADICCSDIDINNDGVINVVDLLAVIDQWGTTNSPADINSDGIVNVSDLLIVVSNWGVCE